MPWPPRQRKAIAANLSRQGKSREEISSFFRQHGHGGEKPSRRTQPYRRGARPPGRALSAMLAGKPAYMDNPMDVKRRAQKRSGRRTRRKRRLEDLLAG